MTAENKPTIDFLNNLAGRHVIGELETEFLSKEKEERLSFLKEVAEKYAQERGKELGSIDLEGLSEISDEEFVGFLRQAIQKYNTLPHPHPSIGISVSTTIDSHR